MADFFTSSYRGSGESESLRVPVVYGDITNVMRLVWRPSPLCGDQHCVVFPPPVPMEELPPDEFKVAEAVGDKGADEEDEHYEFVVALTSRGRQATLHRRGGCWRAQRLAHIGHSSCRCEGHCDGRH